MEYFNENYDYWIYFDLITHNYNYENGSFTRDSHCKETYTHHYAQDRRRFHFKFNVFIKSPLRRRMDQNIKYRYHLLYKDLRK